MIPGNPRELIVNRSINPLLEDLPAWVEAYRPHQIAAVKEIVSQFERVDVVVCDAPTGSGKTLIGETVRRMMKVPGVYVCSTRGLQDQFVRDFDYAKLLKGRGNYETEMYPERFHPGSWSPNHLSAEDCTWTKATGKCLWCTGKGACPYEVAKGEALGAELAVINTSYLLAEANGPGRFSGLDFVIADEADTLEGELMRHVSVDVSESRMKKLGWFPPERVTVKESWADWIDQHLPLLKKEIASMPSYSDDVRVSRERQFLEGLKDKLAFVRLGLEDSESPWVYTGKGSEGSGRVKEENKGRAVSFKPARVDQMAKTALWKHGKKWLLMSATVISAQEMLESLGWDKEYAVVSCPSTFPVENRKVWYMPAGKMSRNEQEKTLPKMIERLGRIMDDHPKDRVLIHTVSYRLAGDLYSGVARQMGEDDYRPLVTYSSAGERTSALAKYIKTPRAVMFASSMDRGIDLPGDLCRVQVVAKIPFPYLGDKQINARMYSRGGRTWYSVQAIRALVQMCGRAVRSEDDWAVTYILDSDFESNLWARGRSMFPSWYREGIQWRSV